MKKELVQVLVRVRVKCKVSSVECVCVVVPSLNSALSLPLLLISCSHTLALSLSPCFRLFLSCNDREIELAFTLTKLVADREIESAWPTERGTHKFQVC